MAGVGVGAADDFAVAGAADAGWLVGQWWFAASAAAADSRFDPAVGDLGAEAVAAVAAVGPDLLGVVAGGEQVVEQRQEVAALVLVAGADPDADGPAVGVDGQVVLR